MCLTGLRGPAVRRLLVLREQGELTTREVRVVAQCLEVTERTVWRWLQAAVRDSAAAAEPGSRAQTRTRFTVTAEIRQLLALWKGNVAAVHRDLAARAAARVPPGAPPPSLPTLHRAIQRDLTAGERAGLAQGERAVRRHDVYLTRPRGHRNEVWETDHVQAPVLVDVQGEPVRPWITWFLDCATCTITGVAVTPGSPSRESVLAALRAAVLRTDPYGPAGGKPETVRMDRGPDYLSRAVQAALAILDVEVEDLPAYSPYLKGGVESLNRSVERMHLAALPGYVHAPRPGRGPAPKAKERPVQPLLAFEVFTAGLLEWVGWWNTEHRPASLKGMTPLQAWLADPTPVREVPAEDLWSLTLEDDLAQPRLVTARGVRFKGRYYTAAWLTGRAGIRVRVRFMPHHDHEIELFDPASGRHLATAHLADRATPEQITAVHRARAERTRRLRHDLKQAERLRHKRYAAATRPEAPRQLGALTQEQAARELGLSAVTDLSALALSDLVPPSGPPPADWVTPASLLPSAPGQPGAGPRTGAPLAEPETETGGSAAQPPQRPGPVADEPTRRVP